MKNTILYGSFYGTAQRYAEALSHETGIPALTYQQVKDLTPYDTIIYIGALYSGNVTGLKTTFRTHIRPKHQRIIIVTVGLADPTEEMNLDDIMAVIENQLPPAIFGSAAFFHLRGTLKQDELGLKHKAIFSLALHGRQSVPYEERSPFMRALSDERDTAYDHYDPATLAPIIAAL